jgi:hypothetical protein
MRVLKRWAAGALMVLLGVQSTGCGSWVAVASPSPGASALYPGHQVQVRLHSGGTIAADSTKASADSLTMYKNSGIHAIPLSQVKGIKIRESDNAKTAALTTLFVLSSLFTAALISVAVNPPY